MTHKNLMDVFDLVIFYSYWHRTALESSLHCSCTIRSKSVGVAVANLRKMERGTRKRRRRCLSCGSTLAITAFQRHRTDRTGSVCVGKQVVVTDSSSSSDLFSTEEEDCSEDSNSSFNFESSSDGSDAEVHEGEDEDDYSRSESEAEVTSPESGEEIWDTTENEDDFDDVQYQAKDMLLGIFVFLNFFQLVFRISERAMATLLVFLKTLIGYFAMSSVDNSLLKPLAQEIPKSLEKMRKITDLNHSGIKEYIVCCRCHRLYHSDVLSEEETQVQVCDYVQFPHHPHSSRRKKCDTPLLKHIRVGRKSKMVARKAFFYQSVITGIQKLVSRRGFLQRCEHWRHQIDPPGTYTDLYSGKVWTDFFYVDGRPFLALPGNLCLMLNIDWFAPFDQTIYSVGAIYFVVQNLPRCERFKEENIILVGLIPGPTEPPKNINSYLIPLVDDLLELYDGASISNPNSIFGSTTIRAVLSCIVCDIPATRKVCGFLGKNALKGCSKCLKEFPTARFGAKPDYSGFDCENWPVRKLSEHKKHVSEVKQAKTSTKHSEKESLHGVRYSELLRLPYFDVIRFHVVDPMHNLFLGLAKHTMSTWKELNILNEADFQTLQAKVDALVPPPKIGRIPRKIASGFYSFTADEWKNWVLVYSLYSLVDVLPTHDYQCWCLFVDACRLLCQLVITEQEILAAHELITKFCKKFEELYGPQHCTPNMHLACHIKSCMLDYGPLSAFWAFSFERFNGTLEHTKISWCGPEKQMFTKFLNLQDLKSMELGIDQNFVSFMCSEVYLLTSPQILVQSTKWHMTHHF